MMRASRETTETMAHDTEPRPASTTLILRDGADGVEVLMLRRSLEASFMPGSYVFPGGAVDADDAAPVVQAACDETPQALAERLGSGPPEALAAHAVAALRECFEECGLWLGDGAPIEAGRLPALRAALNATGEPAAAASPAIDGRDLLAAARALGRPLAVSALHPWGHWVTPIDLPKRFDTRFFVAQSPAGQAASVDDGEATALEWIRPADALARAERGELPLEFITRHTLRSLLPYRQVAGVIDEARGRRRLVPQHPRVARDAAGERRVLLPGEPAHAEVQRLDPLGTGQASCALRPGVPVPLAPTLRRLTAPNPGVMTGPGTNTYLIGAAGRHAVLDPGPALDVHLDAILAACADGRIEAVLATHTHLDHSPAARELAARTGARLIGLPAPPGSRQDTSFVPTERPADREWVEVAGLRLQAIHTPGHASNHVCWWYPAERMLFTGDHLMQGSTVVIDPPDGDMSAYLASLRRLPAEWPDLAWLAPGHGFLIDQPARAVERLVAHRLAREAKVLAALSALPAGEAATVAALVPRVYDDVPGGLHPVAARSLLAHLLKLRDDGRALSEPPAATHLDAPTARWRAAG